MLKKLSIGLAAFALLLLLAGIGLYSSGALSALGLEEKVIDSVPPTLPEAITSESSGVAILLFSKTAGYRHEEAIPACRDSVEAIASRRGWRIFCNRERCGLQCRAAGALRRDPRQQHHRRQLDGRPEASLHRRASSEYASSPAWMNPATRPGHSSPISPWAIIPSSGVIAWRVGVACSIPRWDTTKRC
jgi:hypothetical protein